MPIVNDATQPTEKPQAAPAAAPEGGLPPPNFDFPPAAPGGEQSELPPDPADDTSAEDLSGDQEGLGAADPMTPEEQKSYDEIILNAYKIMYSKEGFPTLLSKLAHGSDGPARNIGHTLAMLMLSINGAKRKKDPAGYEPGLIFEAAIEILQDLIRISVGAGFVKAARQAEVIGPALFTAAKLYGDSEIAAGNITPEQQAQAMAELKSTGLDPNQVGGVTPQDKERATQLRAAAAVKDGGNKVTDQQIAEASAAEQQSAGAPPAPPGAPAPQGAPAPGGIVNQAVGAR